MTKDRFELARGWTLDAWMVYSEALREAEIRFQGERDRRYAEVKGAEERALRVKEEADKIALGLARDIQTYKDERDNRLREQLERERGGYATQSDLRAAIDKIEAVLTPLVNTVAANAASQAGGSKGMRDMWGWMFGAVMLAYTLFGKHLNL